jgi:hypothetical protein
MTMVTESRRSWRSCALELADVLGECTFSDPEQAMRAFTILCEVRAMSEVD